MSKAIFFDRDGVINKPVVKDGKPYPPNSLDELALLPNVKLGISKLREAAFKIFVVTNQPDVARGKTPQVEVDKIHNYLKKELSIDEIRCCFHDDGDDCNCRKPKPGMIVDLAKKWNIDLEQSYLVGDRWRDIEAGKAAGLKTILIDYNYNEKRVVADFTCTNFIETINIILT